MTGLISFRADARLPRSSSRPGRRWRCLALAAGLSLPGLVAGSALAQEAGEAPDDAVIATVNGAPVRYSDVILAEQDLAAQLSGVPEDVKFEYLASLMIDRKALADEALKAGLEDDPAVLRQLAYYREKVLGDVYLNRQLADAVSDEEARTFYDKQVAQIDVEEEVRARHILVETEDEALKVISRLDAGEDFAALAKEISTGPTGANGGDLGFFVADRMVPEFSDAAFALQPGEVSKPVKSDFGWHVIKVEERRMQQVVPFEDVKEGIKVQLRDEKAAPFIASVRDKADVKFTGEETARPQIVPQQ
ncbi:peptidylprolyl isomerase [Pyruvatibacter mobilis]|uniref:peptidylprolyl isomerase n=1 Tax=Pyruvatibacter mobilis TaxID=1712261 RepID=UPI003BA9E3A7